MVSHSASDFLAVAERWLQGSPHILVCNKQALTLPFPSKENCSFGENLWSFEMTIWDGRILTMVSWWIWVFTEWTINQWILVELRQVSNRHWEPQNTRAPAKLLQKKTLSANCNLCSKAFIFNFFYVCTFLGTELQKSSSEHGTTTLPLTCGQLVPSWQRSIRYVQSFREQARLMRFSKSAPSLVLHQRSVHSAPVCAGNTHKDCSENEIYGQKIFR